MSLGILLQIEASSKNGADVFFYKYVDVST